MVLPPIAPKKIGQGNLNAWFFLIVPDDLEHQPPVELPMAVVREVKIGYFPGPCKFASKASFPSGILSGWYSTCEPETPSLMRYRADKP